MEYGHIKMTADGRYVVIGAPLPREEYARLIPGIEVPEGHEMILLGPEQIGVTAFQKRGVLAVPMREGFSTRGLLKRIRGDIDPDQSTD